MRYYCTYCDEYRNTETPVGWADPCPICKKQYTLWLAPDILKGESVCL